MEPTLDESLLAAYLDGELTPPDRQSLEQRLADEPELRQRLTLLEETWHYLDLLEQEGTDTEKINTTMRTAAVSLSGKPLMLPKVSQLGKWGIALLAGLVLSITAFSLGKQDPLDDPSFRQMVEQLDMYLVIAEEDLALLQQLTIQRVFLPHMLDSESLVDMKNPRADNAETYQLCYRNSQRFLKLSREKQKQIRKLHRHIALEPLYTELPLTLQNYSYWHKSLQPYERNELAKSKSLDEKVANIVKLKNRLDQLLPNDLLPMPSAVVGIEESLCLADALAKLPAWRKEQLLNKAPILIVNELKQLSHPQ